MSNLISAYRRLTPRQKDVLTLVCFGLSNQAIAYHLGFKLNTAKKHVRDLCDCLGADSRLQLAVWIRTEGLTFGGKLVV